MDTPTSTPEKSASSLRETAIMTAVIVTGITLLAMIEIYAV
jgi:hypothetical protein